MFTESLFGAMFLHKAYIPRPEVFESGDLPIHSLKKREKAGGFIPKTGGKSGENQRVLHC